ncbi:MAG: hypothetical protein M5U12_31610 [Verrucomicrobia bacterium]|nr:hypothetical protein [Verrucomicrobiota bacterium]
MCFVPSLELDFTLPAHTAADDLPAAFARHFARTLAGLLDHPSPAPAASPPPRFRRCFRHRRSRRPGLGTRVLRRVRRLATAAPRHRSRGGAPSARPAKSSTASPKSPARPNWNGSCTLLLLVTSPAWQKSVPTPNPLKRPRTLVP